MQPNVLNLKILSNSWSRLKPRPGIAENFLIPDIWLHRIVIIPDIQQHRIIIPLENIYLATHLKIRKIKPHKSHFLLLSGATG